MIIIITYLNDIVVNLEGSEFFVLVFDIILRYRIITR